MSAIDNTDYGLEDYLINQCSSKNKIKTEHTTFGKINVYKVGSQEISLTFNTYANGEDDFDEELVAVTLK